jgi:hypothetical protein
MDTVMLQALLSAPVWLRAWRFPCRRHVWLCVLITTGMAVLPDVVLAAGSDSSAHTLISSIGISILAATVLAFLAHSPPYTSFRLNGDMELYRYRQLFV